MAMNGINISREPAKKDVNFFAEFTASNRRMTKILGWVIVGGVAVIAALLITVGFTAFTNRGLKKDIKTIQDKLNGPDYQELQSTAAELSVMIEQKTQYYFALTDMRNTVDSTLVAETKLTEILEKNITNDMMIKSYEIVDGVFTISGYTMNYFRPEEMAHFIDEESDVFSNVSCKTTHYFEDGWEYEDLENLSLQSTYTFTITGNLTSDRYVSVRRLANNGETVVAISGVENIKCENGVVSIDVKDIAIGNIMYIPDSILIDDVIISEDEFSNAITNGFIVVPVVHDDCTVEINYVDGSTVSEAEATEGDN